MRALYILALLVAVVLALASMGADAAPAGHSMSASRSASRSQISRAIAIEAKQLLTSDNVQKLTDATFDAFIKADDKFTVVFFHASWNSRSNKFASDFVAVAEEYAVNKTVQFGFIDVKEDQVNARKWDVSAFPTVRMVTRGVTETANTFYDFYNGKEGLVNFIERVMLHEKWRYVKRAEDLRMPGTDLVHPNQGAVIDFTEETFDNFTKSTKFFTFVMFYAPWCGACKDMAGELEAVARYFKLDKHVVIGRVNADDHPKLIARYHIPALPTMYMFPKARLTKRGIRYTMSRERHDMQAAIDVQNRMQDSEDQPYIDENTDMETLNAEMKALGKDPESLMKRFSQRSKDEYKKGQ